MTKADSSFAFGARLTEQAQTRFRLWAPAHETMQLQIEDGDLLDASPEGGGWFQAEAPVSAGARYRWRLPDGTLVPDPASRFQPEGVHRPSSVVDPDAYQWRIKNWTGRPWEEVVLYELHVGLLGGFDAVAERLPALAELGVTAIELMPINAFSGARNWGYDGVLPYAPQHSYGGPDQLKALVDRAHELDLMIFLDVVYNHFGPDGNYLSLYAPQFFREDLKTPWGPAIDFRRPEVRAFFTQNALYWLREYRIDGLRFDAVHAISERDWLDETADAIRGEFGADRHVHLVLENEHNDPELLASRFNAQWNDDFHHVLHHLLTGDREGYYVAYTENTAHQLARALSEGFVYQGETFPYGSKKPRGGAKRETATDRVCGLPPEPRPNRQPRDGRSADTAGGAACSRGGDSAPAAIASHPNAFHG